jgi:hypothetical protein
MRQWRILIDEKMLLEAEQTWSIVYGLAKYGRPTCPSLSNSVGSNQHPHWSWRVDDSGVFELYPRDAKRVFFLPAIRCTELIVPWTCRCALTGDRPRQHAMGASTERKPLVRWALHWTVREVTQCNMHARISHQRRLSVFVVTDTQPGSIWC